MKDRTGGLGKGGASGCFGGAFSRRFQVLLMGHLGRGGNHRPRGRLRRRRSAGRAARQSKNKAE